MSDTSKPRGRELQSLRNFHLLTAAALISAAGACRNAQAGQITFHRPNEVEFTRSSILEADWTLRSRHSSVRAPRFETSTLGYRILTWLATA
jgi:hypothetical protein